MKKLWPLFLLIIAVGLILLVRNSPNKPADIQGTRPLTNSGVLVNKPVATAPTNSALIPAPKPSATKRPARPALLDGDVINDARAAIEKGDMEAVARAYDFFLEYIKAHPENVDEYVAAFSNEQNEHILRALARAMVDAEAGLLENTTIMSAAIDLAKDPSFEQRQHIMLHLMAQFPQMNEEAYQALVALSANDPNSQVKTSAVAALADWMEKFPEKMGPLLEQIGDIFKNTQDESVRLFTYQVLALHKEALTRDLQVTLAERYKIEKDSFTCNLIASSLSVAPEDIRREAITFAQVQLNAAKDLELQRNLLAQFVVMARQDSIPTLSKYSKGDSRLAQDARGYLVIVSSDQPYEAAQIFQEKAIRDAQSITHEPEHAPHP
jgi:hypothetical protein